MMKKLSIVLALCLCLSACSQTPYGDGYTGTEDGITPHQGTTTTEPVVQDPIDPNLYMDSVPDLHRAVGAIGNFVSANVETSGYGKEIHGFSNKYVPISQSVLHTATDDIYILEFSSDNDAIGYASGFSNDGNTYSEDGGLTMIDYVAPIHYWRFGNCIISYASFEGDYLAQLNRAFGQEFAGAGANYYYPMFAEQIVIPLTENSKGLAVTFKRVDPTAGNIYLETPVRICQLNYGGNVLHIKQFATEAEALDHASRFSPDGLTYSGISGNSQTTINLGWAKPTYLFRLGNLVVEYSTDSSSLLSRLVEICGQPFAGPFTCGNSYYDTADLEFTQEFIRIGFNYSEDFEFPQYAIIKSAAELKQYYETYKSVFDLERKTEVYSDTTIGWLDAADKYDEKWFETHDLVLILIEEGSGSIRHEVESVLEYGTGDIEVNINRLSPEMGTDDMAEWCLFLGVQAGKVSPVEKISLDFSTVQSNGWSISMQAQNVTPFGLTLAITRSGGYVQGDIEYGPEFSLEKLENGQWAPVPTLDAEYDFPAEAYVIDKDTTETEEIKWEYMYGNLPKGKYRLCRQFQNADDKSDLGKITVYASFEITDASTNALGVQMSVANVTPSGLTLTVSHTNSQVGECYYGVDYRLEKRGLYTWESVPYVFSDGEVAFEAIAVILEPGKNNTHEINWQSIYGDLPNGKYRICKSFSGNDEKVSVYTVFEIK